MPIPVIIIEDHAPAYNKFPFTWFIRATNNPLVYGATGLPQGLTINTNTGAISGYPTPAGNYTVTVKAINSSGTGTQVFILNVSALDPSPIQPPRPGPPKVITPPGPPIRPGPYPIHAAGLTPHKLPFVETSDGPSKELKEKVRYFLPFLYIEALMRAIQERYLRSFPTSVAYEFPFPKSFYNQDGSPTEEDIGLFGTSPQQQPVSNYVNGGRYGADFPFNAFYANDIRFSDQKLGRPPGTYYKNLLNDLIDRLESPNFLDKFVNTEIGIEGKNVIPVYDSLSLPIPAQVGLESVYTREDLVEFQGIILKLNTLFRGVDPVDHQHIESNFTNAGNCENSVNLVVSSFNAKPWLNGQVTPNNGAFLASYYAGPPNAGQNGAHALKGRTKLHSDLSTFAGGGVGTIYCIFKIPIQVPLLGQTQISPKFFPDLDVYNKINIFSPFVGTDWTSGYYPQTDSPIVNPGLTCPSGLTPDGTGFQFDNNIVTVEPFWVNNGNILS